MGNFTYNCKQYFSFDLSEVFQILVTSLVAGFVLSFNDWGGVTVDVGLGITNFFLGFFSILIGLSFHVLTQKLIGIKLGYVVKYGFWKLGLAIGALLTFITAGFIPVFFTGLIEVKVVERLRVGKFQPRFKIWEMGVLSFAGIMANLLLVWLAKPFVLSGGSYAAEFFITSNLWLIFWSLIPLPLFHGVKVIESGRTAYDFRGGTMGFNLFFANRVLYAFFFTTTFVYMILILLANVFAFILSAVVGIAMAVVFFFSMEKG